MAVDIDTLQIEVEASSANAAESINFLCESLQRLQGIANRPGLEHLAKSLKLISSIKAPSTSKLESDLAKTEAQAEKAGNALLALQEKLDGLKEFRGIGTPLTSADTETKIWQTEAALEEAAAAVDSLDSKIRSLRAQIQAGGQASVQAVTTANASLQQIAQSVGTVSGDLQPAAKSCEALAANAEAIEKPMEVVAASAKVIEQPLKSATASAKEMGQALETAAKKGNSGFTALGKTIASAAKRMIVFRLISGLFSGMKDSLGQMAAENEDVNATLSSIASSVQYVKDALASAIYPIIKAIAPVVVTILDAVAQIFNLIGRVVGFFTGQSYVPQATKQQVDFAESVNGTADALHGAAGAAKELFRELLPIDELNIFDPSGGGGGGSTIGGIRFEEVPTDTFDFNLPDWLSKPFSFPGWTPNPVPAPAFEPLQLPSWALSPLPALVWALNPIIAPAFEKLMLPDWALSPLPALSWALNPIPAPEIDSAPLLKGLQLLQTAVAKAWSFVMGEFNLGAASVNSAYGQLATSTNTTTQDTQTTLQNWATVVKAIFQDLSAYIPLIVPPSFQAVALLFSVFSKTTSKDVADWAVNVASNVRTAVAYIPEAIASGFSTAGESIASWVNSTSSNIAAWGINLIQNAGASIKGFYENFVSGLSAAWKSFTEFLKATGEKISGWWSANKSWVVPVTVGVGIAGLTVAAVALSGGAALPALAILPALADGGVLTEPTAVLAGEYPGAKSNPEIVTPQNILRETFREEQNNEDLINIIVASTQQIIAEMRAQDRSVYLDGRKLAEGVTENQNRQNRMYGKTLQNV